MKLTGIRQYYSIPNIISYIRILMVPFIIYNYIYTGDMVLVGVLLILSGLSDALDGFIARKFNQITDFGKVIDPIADKVTQFAVIIMLVYRYPVIWALLIVYILKDLIIAYANYYLYKYRNQKPVGSKWYGRLSTLLFYVLAIVLIFFNIPYNTVFTVTIIYTLYVGLTADLYTFHFYKRYKESANISLTE